MILIVDPWLSSRYVVHLLAFYMAVLSNFTFSCRFKRIWTIYQKTSHFTYCSNYTYFVRQIKILIGDPNLFSRYIVHLHELCISVRSNFTFSWNLKKNWTIYQKRFFLHIALTLHTLCGRLRFWSVTRGFLPVILYIFMSSIWQCIQISLFHAILKEFERFIKNASFYILL